MATTSIVILGCGILALAGGIFLYFSSRRLKTAMHKREEEMERRMYELAILKELADRTGYSFNVQKIIDIITGSLHQFMEYSAVSYMLLQPEKIIFKVHLEKSVSRGFVNDIQDRMLKSVSALLSKEFKKDQVEEVITGAILVEEMKEPVRSFFNIPLVIGEEVVGVLTIADTKPDLYGEEETTILYKITRQASQAVTRLQEVIETEQRKLNAMVESMAEGVVMTDKDYRVLVVNPAAKNAVGMEDKKEVTIFDFIDRLGGKFDIRGKLEESVKLDKQLKSGDVLIGDKYFQIFVSPVKGSMGMNKEQIFGGVVIFHDITHDKEVEKMREDFTSMMVHELRSPLNGIYMLTQLMEKQKKMEKKLIAKNVGIIQNSASSMLTLVNDLLDAAKLESGKFEIQPAPTDLKGLINERIEFYKPLAQDKQLSITAKFGPDLPAKVNLDPVRISQVLNNLVSNAIKFTQPGGHVTIKSFHHKQNVNIQEEAKGAGVDWQSGKTMENENNFQDSVVVAVTDTGEGMSTENISRLFNKFVQFQSKAKGKEQKGTGLGLVIAKGIIEAHHGIIKVTSEEGKGSTFYFLLPM